MFYYHPRRVVLNLRNAFNTVLHVMVNSNRKVTSLLLHNSNFVTAMDPNISTWYAGDLVYDPHRLRAPSLETCFFLIRLKRKGDGDELGEEEG